jgi:putative tryptophan/tyrosine transport system substrate-binding protein
MHFRQWKRREFIKILGGVAAWPHAALAQRQERPRRIGVLMVLAENDPQSQTRVAALQQGLEKLGWTVGRNLAIDYRWGVSDAEQARAVASELLSLAPDLIVANAVSAARGAKLATRTVPIVFAGVSEPVTQGFVASLARPGGNITGFTNFEPGIGGKWVELLKETAPVMRIVVMFNPASTSAAAEFIRSIKMAAAKFHLETVEAHVHEAAEIEPILTKFGHEPGFGLILLPDSFIGFHHKSIIELAGRFRLPAIYPFRYFADAGSLISYGPDVTDQFRRVAGYVDRIFRGEAPGDLPVQQPTKFELVINLKTARALGIDAPAKLIAGADEVIE